MKRRLTCLLAMDAFGYSRLVGADEANTMRVLTAHRAVIDGIIAFHEGRIVNTAGDSVLAEFGSVVEGVRCAVEIQEALRTRNESLPESQRMLFRIGLNLGEVVIKGDDLLGDGVNVAARLQSIAEPGGILVSSSVYDQITGKLDLGFDDIGVQELKNISRPIRAFRVSGARLPAAAVPAPPAPTPAKAVAKRGQPGRAIAALALVLAAALGIAWWQGWIGAPAPADPTLASAGAERSRIEAELATERSARAAAEAAAVKAKAESEAAAVRAQAERDAAAARARAESDAAATRAKAREAARPTPAPASAPAPAARTDTAAAPAQSAATPHPSTTAPAQSAAAQPPTQPAAAPQPTVATPAPAAAVGARRFDGDWIATEECGPMEQLPGFTRKQPFVVRDGEIVIERGSPGEPGYGRLNGRPGDGGRLVLTGHGISSAPQFRGQRFKARFVGAFVDGRFDLAGTLGSRQCRLVLERSGRPQTR